MSFRSIQLWGALSAIALVGAAQEPISTTASKADRDEYRELSSLIRPTVDNGPKSDQQPIESRKIL